MRSRWAIVVFLAALLLVWLWPRDRPWPIVNAQPTGTTIIAFGDSLTAGQGVQREDAYPAQLARALGVQVINAGKSGETTVDALGRLKQDVLGLDPRIVLLEFGANDFFQKRDVNETFANLRSIIEKIQATGALVIVIGVNVPMGNYENRFEALARETGCPLVPNMLRGLLGDREFMVDGIHPNARGYEIVTERVKAVIEPYIGQQ